MKSKPCSAFLFIGLALMAGIHSASAQLTLGILPTNQQAMLYWPQTATNYILQSSTDLHSTNLVSAADIFPAAYGSNTAVTVTNTFTARFFRLRLVAADSADGMALIPAGAFTDRKSTRRN